jgi:tetratricopeptide (TPR) repeat protein
VSARDYVRLGDRFRMSLSPEKGSYDLALAEYEKALKIEPYNPVALAKASRMYFALGISSRAVSVLSLCIEKNPNYVTPYELLGEWYLSTGDYTRAVSLLAEALAINPYNPLTHINLARSYMAAGRQEDARGEFSNALILDPGNPYLIRMTGGNR